MPSLIKTAFNLCESFFKIFYSFLHKPSYFCNPLIVAFFIPLLEVKSEN